MQLDDREFQTTLGSSRAEYASADADYKRGKAIYDRSQALSKSDLEKLATQRSLAANRLKEVQLALEETRLLAPFAGIVGRKLVDDFAQVSANQALVIVQALEVMIQVPDKVVGVVIGLILFQVLRCCAQKCNSLSSRAGRSCCSVA